MRMLRFKGVGASTGSVAICASKLQHYAKRMFESCAHNELGKQFLELSRECHNMINEEAEALWLTASNGFCVEQNIDYKKSCNTTYKLVLVILLRLL